MKIELQKLTCLRCGHVWTPRSNDVRECPACQSTHWDEPKKEKEG